MMVERGGGNGKGGRGTAKGGGERGSEKSNLRSALCCVAHSAWLKYFLRAKDSHYKCISTPSFIYHAYLQMWFMIKLQPIQ